MSHTFPPNMQKVSCVNKFLNVLFLEITNEQEAGRQSVMFLSTSIVMCVFYCISFSEFPSGFESHVRKMLRLLFHVIAHMYAGKADITEKTLIIIILILYLIAL